MLDEVEAFAAGEYAHALFMGAGLPAKDRKAVVAKLARYTGLSADYIERTDLRIEIFRFCKELLRDEGRTVGRLDSRFTGRDRDSAGEQFEFDPAMVEIYGAYAAAMNDYVRSDLRFEADLPYEVIKGLYLTWGWKDYANRFASVGETLRKAMSKNPHMRVLVASGYYDFATPHYGADYSISHFGLAPELRKNVAVSYYEAAHDVRAQAHYLQLQKLREFVAGDLQALARSAARRLANQRRGCERSPRRRRSLRGAFPRATVLRSHRSWPCARRAFVAS